MFEKFINKIKDQDLNKSVKFFLREKLKPLFESFSLSQINLEEKVVELNEYFIKNSFTRPENGDEETLNFNHVFLTEHSHCKLGLGADMASGFHGVVWARNMDCVSVGHAVSDDKKREMYLKQMKFQKKDSLKWILESNNLISILKRIYKSVKRNQDEKEGVLNMDVLYQNIISDAIKQLGENKEDNAAVLEKLINLNVVQFGYHWEPSMPLLHLHVLIGPLTDYGYAEHERWIPHKFITDFLSKKESVVASIRICKKCGKRKKHKT